MIILLLTACINPNNMSFTVLNNKEVRKKQYVEALEYYLSNSNYKIVFVENSNTDISSTFSKDIDLGRLEYLSFQGNKDKNRGKGYGECEIIEYALKHSNIINRNINIRIVKITGRLIVKNIKFIASLHNLCFPKKTVFYAINSDLSFPDSRCIMASKYFFLKFLEMKYKINDSAGYYFEHALLATTIKEKEYSYSPFYFQPDIVGMSGSTGEAYISSNHSITYICNHIHYAISLRVRFRKKYRTC